MSDLHARQCPLCTVFMQHGAPSHINCCVIDVLKRHSPKERIFSRHFPDLRPPRFPNLDPCDVWALDEIEISGKL